LYDGVLDTGVVEYIAARAVRRGGDARYALDLLMVACDQALINNETKVTVEHVKYAVDEVEKNFLKKTVLSLKYPEKILLFIVSFYSTIKVELAYKLGNKFFANLKGEEITPRRWSDYRSNLELYGYLKTITKGRGRGRGVVHFLQIDGMMDRKVIVQTLINDFKKVIGKEELGKLLSELKSLKNLVNKDISVNSAK